jgi:hypothetical protein
VLTLTLILTLPLPLPLPLPRPPPLLGRLGDLDEAPLGVLGLLGQVGRQLLELPAHVDQLRRDEERLARAEVVLSGLVWVRVRVTSP